MFKIKLSNMEPEKCVVEDKMGPVKDLHARFEKTRKPLGEIPASSSRLGDEISKSTINMKSTLQEWEHKTYTPFLTPQKQKLTQSEHLTRSEPKGNRFARERKFDRDEGDESDGEEESGGPGRRTSMPAAGAVKNALKQYLANSGQTEKEAKNLGSSPHPGKSGSTKSRRALVPKMGSIEEDQENNDENEPMSIDIPVPLFKVQTSGAGASGSGTESGGLFEVGLKGLRKTPAKSKVISAVEVQSMDEWKSPAKSITKSNTTCKQKGYIFDEFAVGLKALKSSKKTEVTDKPLTPMGNDEPPVINSFEVGLKALRTPKKLTLPDENKEPEEEKLVPAVSSFAIGLKALRTPKKANLVVEMKSREAPAFMGEVTSFNVGLKALRKVDNQESKESKFEKKVEDVTFKKDLKPVKKVCEVEKENDDDDDNENELKQKFVALKSTKLRNVREKGDSANNVPCLTDVKLKLKPTGKVRKGFGRSDENEDIDWSKAKSKLKPVTAEDRSNKADEGEERAGQMELLDIREDKIDWNLAKKRLKSSTSTPVEEEKGSDAEKSTGEDPKQAVNVRLSALSKSNPLDETLMVDMDDTVSDFELEGIVKCNIGLVDDSILQLDDDASVKLKPSVEAARKEDAKKSEELKVKLKETLKPPKSPKRQAKGSFEDEEDQPVAKAAKEDTAEVAKTTKELKEAVDEKEAVLDRKRVRSDDSEESSSSVGKTTTFKSSVSLVLGSAPSAEPVAEEKAFGSKSPRKKKPKLLSYDDDNYLTSSLSPGNLFIDPNTPSTVDTPISSQELGSESGMDTTSPTKSSPRGKGMTKVTLKSPSRFSKLALTENEVTDKSKTEDKLSPLEGVSISRQNEEYCEIFSSTPAPLADDTVAVNKGVQIDDESPAVHSKFSFSSAASQSPAVAHRKLDCSVEEYSDTTSDIIRRWKERRHFLNLKGSPRTVEERMEEEEEEEDVKKVTHPLLPQTEDTAHSKVSHFLSSLPGSSTEAGEIHVGKAEVPEKKSSTRLSTHSKRSSTLSHTSVRSREEMEADLDKGMLELERRLQMFDDDDDGSPICSAIRKGPAHFATKMSKTNAKVAKRTKQETISESDESNNEAGENEEKRMKPSTSGSDVLDFIKEKRTRLMQIQDESIHLDSDTDADDSQLEPNPHSGNRTGRADQRYPLMGISGSRRRRSRSAGRQVPLLGTSSPKNTYAENALNRLGLCTPSRHELEPVYPRRRNIQALCTPHRSDQRNVYVVDMESTYTSDDSDNRYSS